LGAVFQTWLERIRAVNYGDGSDIGSREDETRRENFGATLNDHCLRAFISLTLYSSWHDRCRATSRPRRFLAF
jgi:hypothetical protein